MATSHFSSKDLSKKKENEPEGQAGSQEKKITELLNLNVLLIGDVANKEKFYNFIDEVVQAKLGHTKTDKAELTPGLSFYHTILITPNCKFQVWLIGEKSFFPVATPQIVLNFANTTQMLEASQYERSQYEKAHLVVLTKDGQTERLAKERKVDVRPVPQNQHEATQTLISIGDELCKASNQPNQKILDKYYQQMYQVLAPIVGVQATSVVAEYVELDCIEQKQRNPLLANFFMQQNQKNKLSFMVAQALEIHNPLLLVEVYLHYKENKDERRAGSIFNTLRNLISEMDINVRPYVRKIREYLNDDPRLQELKLEPSSAEARLPGFNPLSINITTS